MIPLTCIDFLLQKESGTNPPIVTTYIAGLRGKVAPLPSAAAAQAKESPYYEFNDKRRQKAAKDFKSDFQANTTSVYPKVGVVTLKLDL